MASSNSSDSAFSFLGMLSSIASIFSRRDTDEVRAPTELCEICLEQKDEEEMFEVEICNHFFCTECITMYVETKVMTENVSDLKCPAVGCKLGRIDYDSCQELVSKECMAKLDEVLCTSLFDSTEKFHCPYKNCSAMLLSDTDEVIKESECPECRRLFCANCGVPWHSGLLCHQFQQLGKNKMTNEDVLFEELAKKNSWTKCPNCNYRIEKTMGCIHMKCRCGMEFCYACEAVWSNRHACPPPPAPSFPPSSPPFWWQNFR